MLINDVIKLFFTVCLLFGKSNTHIFTATERRELQNPQFSIKLLQVSIINYTLDSNINVEFTNCCNSVLDGSNCEEVCTGTFIYTCNGEVAGTFRSVPLKAGTFSTKLLAEITSNTCFTSKNKGIFFQIDHSEGKFFEVGVNDASPNQLLQNQVSIKGGNVIQYDVGKLCHPFMGENCGTPCVASSFRQQCDFQTGTPFCRTGYSGGSCEIGDGPCTPNPCLYGGKCIVSNYDIYTCECPPDRVGGNCEYSRCNLANCIHGECQTDGSCLCSNGYTGLECNDEVCTENLCGPNGKCEKNGHSAICKCDLQITNGRRCTNNCKIRCGLRTVCVHRIDVFCQCPEGYSLPICTTKKYLLPCGNNYKCSNEGVCKILEADSHMKPVCICNPGFRGRYCEDKMCLKHVCFNGVCMEGGGCVCKLSYFGLNCNTRACGTRNFCINGGSCVAIGNTVTCNCPRNFAGFRCQHQCPFNCTKNGRCVVGEGVIKCECDHSYTGKACELFKADFECSKLGCLHGGKCGLVKRKYACFCTPQWTGEDCSIPTCRNIECNHGSCLSGAGCVCEIGYTGVNCINPSCSNDFCSNNGLCVIRSGRKSCNCLRSFYGRKCEYSCKEGCINGVCVNNKGKSQCHCKPGFVGSTCASSDYTAFVNNVILIILIIVGILLLITFITTLVANVNFSRERYEKVFIKGTIKEGFSAPKAKDNAAGLEWDKMR